MPLYNPEGKVIGLIGISFDITDYKKMTEQLEQLGYLNKQLCNDLVDNRHEKKYVSLPQMLQENNIDRFYLAGQFDNIYLTKREAECILQLAKGNTAKQIGRTLDLSPRTVETYVAKVKSKLECHTTTEMLSKLIPFLKGL